LTPAPKAGARCVDAHAGICAGGRPKGRSLPRYVAGLSHSRFQRALTTGNLQLIETAASELPKVSLEDALAILIVLAQRGDPRFERAAARWVGRLLTETPADLSDARFALALVERLPRCRDALHGLARRR
jgi:hypothetical protein